MTMERSSGVRAKSAGALERIKSLEDTIPQILQSINQAFGQMSQEVNSLKEQVEAMSSMLGPDLVESTIANLRKEKADKFAADQKTQVEEALKTGDLVKVEVISDKALVVGTEFDAKGEAVGNGRVQLPYKSIKPEYQKEILGKGVGATFQVTGDGKFVVNEIYEAVEKPATPVAPEAPAAPACDPAACKACEGCTEPAPEKV